MARSLTENGSGLAATAGGLCGGTVPGWRRRSANGADDSLMGDLDPVLADLVEEFSQRALAGEAVDVEQLCDEHPTLAASLRRLLPALETLAQAGKAIDGDAKPLPSVPPETPAGSDFGDFRIIREIGRGGMGIVYEARQVAIDRRVALKVLPLAAAMDPRALRRFQVEAQVAGLLQHPHIVPVHSLGLFGDVPYFAMQLIDGGSLADLITELRGLTDRAGIDGANSPVSTGHSDLALSLLTGQFPERDREPESELAGEKSASGADRPLPAAPRSIRGRSYVRTVVRLGIQAAQALGYAHEQGITHRDIKPANLLLDRRGHLWVADFGMADVQGDAGLTLTGDLPGTLRYMSPEQALGKRALVDRRTDIYSLGATLYELLSLQPAVAGTDRQEIFHRIAEVEPESLRRLNPMVPADLATIVSKALSKEPLKRYETARHFADDLVRFLDGRPIAARPVGRIERSWRWCRRRPVQACLIVSLVVALVVGFAGIIWNWREAVRQRSLSLVAQKDALAQAARAQTESAKADAINRFLVEKLLLQAEPGNNPDAIKVTLLEVVDRAAAEVGKSFAAQPEIEADIRITIARIYHGIGQLRAAEAHMRAAYTLQKNIPGPDRVETLAELGHILVHQHRLDEAEPLLRQAYEETRAVQSPARTMFLKATGYLAQLERWKGRDDVAEGMLREAVEEGQRTLGPNHPDTITANSNLGVLLEKRKKYADAERIFCEVLRVRQEIMGPEHPATSVALFNLGYVLRDLGRVDEAEQLIQRSVDVRQKLLGPEHPDTLTAVAALAEIRGKRGDRKQAQATLRKCLEAQTRVLGKDHHLTQKTRAALELLGKGQHQLDANTSVARPPSEHP